MALSQILRSSRPPPLFSVPPARAQGRARAFAPFLFAAVLIAAPQLLGGIYPWGMLAIAFGCGLSLAAALVSAKDRELPSRLLLLVAGIPLAFTALQALPLPCGLVELIAPLSVTRLEQAHVLLGLDKPSQCTISRDPAATREEIVKGFALACALLNASLLAHRERQRQVFLAVAASVVAMAACAGIHSALGLTKVFGIYEPIEIRNVAFLAPLLNPNNLGGFLVLGVPILFGLALEASDLRVRVVLMILIGGVATMVLMTRSRGAAGALALSVSVFALLALLSSVRGRERKPKEQERRRAPRPALAVTLMTVAGASLALGLAAYAWFDELAAEFQGSGWDKIELIAHVFRFAALSPLVGVGRGGFSAAFVGQDQNRYRFDYAENLIAQWATDWGYPLALGLTAALVILLAQSAVRARSSTRIGALAGVIALGAQNMVDIGLELLGPATVALATLGAAVTFPSVARPNERHTRIARRALQGLCVITLAGSALLAPALVRDHGPEVEQRLQALLKERKRDEFRALLTAGMLAHPSEPMLAILGAHEALLSRDRKAPRFINRGMVLAPGWSAPHAQAFQWLWATGHKSQALIELREAAARAPFGLGNLVCRAAKEDPAAVIAAAPDPPARIPFLVRVVGCLEKKSEPARAIDALLMREAPELSEPFAREAGRLLAEGKPKPALDALEQARRRAPDDDELADLAAQAWLKLNRPDQALALLERALAAGAPAERILMRKAALHAEQQDREGMRDTLLALRARADGRAGALLRAYRLEAQLNRKLGDMHASLNAYEQAYRITGAPEALRGVAITAEQLGHKRRALNAYSKLCGQADDSQDACAHRDRLVKAERAHAPSPTSAPPQPSSR